MSIRLPLKGVLDYDDTSAYPLAASTLGGVPVTFTLPQDTDNVIVKYTASVVGGGGSVIFQTTDDGGTTWYDVAKSSIVSNTAGNANAEWLSIPTISGGVVVNPVTASALLTGCVFSFSQSIGNAAASVLGSKRVSGLPILGPLNRVFIQYVSGTSAVTLSRVQVKANNGSARA